MDRKAFIHALILGTALQLAMVLAGHWVAFIKDHVFAIGGVLVSLIAGLIYARRAAGGWGSSLAGGFLVGGLCALIGIAVSFALKDVPASILAFGTLGSAIGGLIGGALGKLWK